MHSAPLIILKKLGSPSDYVKIGVLVKNIKSFFEKLGTNELNINNIEGIKSNSFQMTSLTNIQKLPNPNRQQREWKLAGK